MALLTLSPHQAEVGFGTSPLSVRRRFQEANSTKILQESPNPISLTEQVNRLDESMSRSSGGAFGQMVIVIIPLLFGAIGLAAIYLETPSQPGTREPPKKVWEKLFKPIFVEPGRKLF